MPQAREPATKLPAVSGEDPAEVRLGLESGEEAVGAEPWSG
jgi:hypothetical protein